MTSSEGAMFLLIAIFGLVIFVVLDNKITRLERRVKELENTQRQLISANQKILNLLAYLNTRIMRPMYQELAKLIDLHKNNES